MSPPSFTSRSTGVLFWAAGYLVAAIAWGLGLAALWPQGTACTTSCGARIEAGAVAMTLLAGGGLVGLVLAIWLGVTRRPQIPRRLAAVLVGILAAALVTALAVQSSAPATGDSSGLGAVHAAWSWAFAVPSSALLVTALAAHGRNLLQSRRSVRPRASARARRA